MLTEKEIDEKVGRILAAKKRLSEFVPEAPDFGADKKLFYSISQNSITAGTPVDKTKKTLFVIADERAEAVNGEVAFASRGAEELKKFIDRDFKNSQTMFIDICPSADKIADVLYYGLKNEQVVFIVHAPVKAYAGTSHFHKPVLSLIEGMQKRTAAVVVWGNAFAADDLPKGINTFVCYDFGDYAEALFEKLT